MPTSNQYEQFRENLKETRRRWLVTGAAGFIGSHLVEHLLNLGQEVIGLDNLSTGSKSNIESLLGGVSTKHRENFTFIEADIRDAKACLASCEGVEIVLHQAALGSVPRSIKDPLTTHETNVTGFLNMMEAARKAGVGRFVFASSSSLYGDSPHLPKQEDIIGNPLSPYAVSKRANELYAKAYRHSFGFSTIGLRYFNVFGPRQSPDGPYAAVIPKWCRALLQGERPHIYGDGETSRDFCYVDNAVSANLLAALAGEEAVDKVFNVACGHRTTLNELYGMIRTELSDIENNVAAIEPDYRDFRSGDVRHSLADVSRAQECIGYEPIVLVDQGIKTSVSWFARHSEG